MIKKIILIVSIFLIILINSCNQEQKANIGGTKSISDEERYFCETDTECVQYGTCTADCVNKNWATNNLDKGPFCELLLPEFNCRCIENKCTPFEIGRK